MQTDSHMDVVQDWDAKLMAMWGRVNNEYGILTTYVHRIEQLQDGYENKREVPHLCQVWVACVLFLSGRVASRFPSKRCVRVVGNLVR